MKNNAHNNGNGNGNNSHHNVINYITYPLAQDKEEPAGDAPIITIWHDESDLSMSYILPEQREAYDVDVYARNNVTGELYDLAGDGTFISSEDHNISFYGLPSDTILAGNLFGDGGIYDAPDISDVDGTFTVHVDLIGAATGEVMHDISTLVVI